LAKTPLGRNKDLRTKYIILYFYIHHFYSKIKSTYVFQTPGICVYVRTKGKNCGLLYETKINMLNRIHLIIALLLANTQSFGQQLYISGSVADAATKLPLARASVYINNTTVGTSTSADGRFTLGPLHAGQYDVVVSFVGYNPQIVSLMLTQNSTVDSFLLVPKAKKLEEILILSSATRKKYLELFRQQVLGFTQDADRCIITNLNDVQFIAGENKDEINAWCENELYIKHPSLGYNIYFTLTDFYYHKFSGACYFFGYTRFQEQSPNGRIKSKWKRNRRNTYNGSSKHFFKSLVTGRLAVEGFEILQLKKQAKTTRDSTSTTTPNLPGNAITPAYTPSASDTLYSRNSDSSETYITYGLRIGDGWLINFKQVTKIKLEIQQKFLLYRQPPAGTGSGIRLMAKETPVVDNNGNLLNPRSIYYDGVWAFERLANMLPDDYVPEK
jgi:hypothetical protein